MVELTPAEIVIRLLVAVIAGGLVGFERDMKGHDAGTRTHILVCMGAAIATMIQVESVEWGVRLVRENPDIASSISFDIARITAQVISGIGFLGAGTIIVTNRSVSGLTTAASIWAIAAVGMAAGMGYYFIVSVSSILILLVLRVFKRMFRIRRKKRIEISYVNRTETLEILRRFFEERNIEIGNIEYSVDMEDPERSVCHDLFTLGFPQGLQVGDVITELMNISTILHLTTVQEDIE